MERIPFFFGRPKKHIVIDDGVEDIEIDFGRENANLAVVTDVTRFSMVATLGEERNIFLCIENVSENMFLSPGVPEIFLEGFSEWFFDIFLVAGERANSFVFGGKNDIGQFFQPLFSLEKSDFRRFGLVGLVECGEGRKKAFCKGVFLLNECEEIVRFFGKDEFFGSFGTVRDKRAIFQKGNAIVDGWSLDTGFARNLQNRCFFEFKNC